MKEGDLSNIVFHRIAIQKGLRWRHCVSQNYQPPPPPLGYPHRINPSIAGSIFKRQIRKYQDRL